MRVSLARNAVLTAPLGGQAVIHTPPVPLRGMDRCTMIPVIVTASGTVPAIEVFLRTQVSIDGATWVSQGTAVLLSGLGPSAGAPQATLTAVYVRLELTLGALVASTDLSATVDVPAILDREAAPCDGCDASEPCHNCAKARYDGPEVVTPEPFSGTETIQSAGGSGGGDVTGPSWEPPGMEHHPVPMPGIPRMVTPAPLPLGDVGASSRQTWGPTAGPTPWIGEVVRDGDRWITKYPERFDESGNRVPFETLHQWDAQLHGAPPSILPKLLEAPGSPGAATVPAAFGGVGLPGAGPLGPGAKKEAAVAPWRVSGMFE